MSATHPKSPAPPFAPSRAPALPCWLRPRGWQWVLFVNVPVTAAAAALAPFLIRESRADTMDHSVDYAGAALGTGGLAAVLYALVNAGTAGWGSGQTTGLLALGVTLLAVFVWVEGKVRSPLVPLRIFRVGQVRGANIAMVLMAAAMVGLFFVLTLYLQDVMGYSAIKAALASVPLGVVLITVAGLALSFVALTIAVAITAVVLPRRSRSVPGAEIATTTAIAAAVPAA